MYAHRVPAAPLNRFIECLWYVDDRVPYQREKILPTGTLELMINFGSPHRLIDKADECRYSLMRESWIAGFQTEFLLNEPVAETLMLGVRFKPGGAFPFFDLPIDELSNFVIDLDLIWGCEAEEIRERLLAEATVTGRFRLMEMLLLDRMRVDCYGLDAVQYAVEVISRRHGALSIASLSEDVGISQKHLNQQFRRMVGVSPKVLARVMKLQKLLYSIDPSQPINWVDLAYRCHYYDQSHFNHDFAAFTGLSPGDYIRLRQDVFGDLKQGEEVHFVPVA